LAGERLKSPRLRLFVALDLPEQDRERIVAWQQEAFDGRRDLRLVPPFSLHMTLVFLGYQAERDVERITEVSFAEPPAEPFSLRPTDLVEVPPRRPRLYALGIEDEGGRLAAWQSALAGRLEAAGLHEPEKRPFWTHLTVARFKQTERHRTGGGARGGTGRGGPAARPEPLPELPDELREPVRAGRLTLYKSTLRPQGAAYEALARIEPGSGAAPPAE
jgi:2'-5' RNA ligase